MKQHLFYVLFFGICCSCNEIYNPVVDTDGQILVVEGLITDEQTSYNIKLSYTTSDNGFGSIIPAQGANVYVKDKNGQAYQFTESYLIPGSYYSNPSEFAGTSGNEYTLHITTSEGETYESTPQMLLRNLKPAEAYGEKSEKKYLIERNGYVPITAQGATIFLKFNNPTDTLLRFKFNYTQLYGAIGSVKNTWDGAEIAITTYYWKLQPYSSDFSLSDTKYTVSSDSNFGHKINFFENLKFTYFLRFTSKMITLDSVIYAETDQTFDLNISKRILYIKQYRLNDDAYRFYKSVDDQLKANSKIFDPVDPQITNNIFCTSNPQKIALGFFETSPVTYLSYLLKFNSKTGEPSLTSVPYLIPATLYGATNKRPPFWNY